MNKTNIKREYDFVASNPSSILLPFLNSLVSYLSVKNLILNGNRTFLQLIPVQFCSLSYILLVSYLSVKETNIKWEYDFVATNPSSILLSF